MTTSLEDSKIAIVMPSCDRYSSLWQISLAALDKYWVGRPRALYLISNHVAAEFQGVTQILVGQDISWSDNLALALKHIPEAYIFLALDDLVMLPGTDSERLNRILAKAIQGNWDYLRVNPLPRPDNSDQDGLGRSHAGEAYRSSTVWSLWRKDVLESVLQTGENAWQFEKGGSLRTDRFAEWWASSRTTIPYANVITAGRSDPAALARLQAAGFDVSCIDFPVMSAGERRMNELRRIRSRALRLVPSSLRRLVLRTFAKW